MANDRNSGTNIMLAGFMGTGKSSVGRCLAAMLGMAFLDTDALIEAEAGAVISEIFRTRGETWFRRLEARAVRQASRLNNTVISLGGGALMDQRNINALKRAGVMVWLRTSPENVLARLQAEGAASIHARPVLEGRAELEQVRSLMSMRERGYRQAHVTIDTDGKRPEEIAREVARSAARQPFANEAGACGETSAAPGSPTIVADPTITAGGSSPLIDRARQRQRWMSMLETHPAFLRFDGGGSGPVRESTWHIADTAGEVGVAHQVARCEVAFPQSTAVAHAYRHEGRVLDIAAGSAVYAYLLGHSLLSRSDTYEAAFERPCPDGEAPPGTTIVITAPLLRSLFGTSLEEGLRNWLGRNARIVWAMVPNGERAKSLPALGRLYDLAAASGARRDLLVIALGGGTVGDVAGFFASTYMRGLRLVHVPTTLLAMVDSAVGGKTAINLRAAKNLAGTFWQPVAVIADIATLGTLPLRDLTSGLAEVVKAAVIGDPGLFEILEHVARVAGGADTHGTDGCRSTSFRRPRAARFAAARALQQEPALLRDIIRTAVMVKAGIVAMDERDAGDRLLLNLGHTLGHAIERAGGFRRWTHGESVAIGLAAACRASARLGYLQEETSGRVIRLLAGLGLPTSVPHADDGALRESILAAMALDKKARGGGLRVVLPLSIGKCSVCDGPAAEALMNEVVAKSSGRACKW